ncbi:thioredoxin domain-containing protein 8 [Phodopus roborovskii]|uniref:thioredoxin domain-containing protein 8 n=1 Tax=Phodopus roborovskii TaxID=109678 RepID=UPI0021E4FE9D|nr:thioredoxin domain-containing protein 8 [Phodopus roborovskii]
MAELLQLMVMLVVVVIVEMMVIGTVVVNVGGGDSSGGGGGDSDDGWRQWTATVIHLNQQERVVSKSQMLIMVQIINDMDELKQLLKAAGSRLVVVEFSAKWCGPCKMVGPIFQAMSLKYQNVMFASVDVDSSKELTQLCDIKAVPTFQMFKHTQKIFEFHGADAKKLELKIQELM